MAEELRLGASLNSSMMGATPVPTGGFPGYSQFRPGGPVSTPSRQPQQYPPQYPPGYPHQQRGYPPNRHPVSPGGRVQDPAPVIKPGGKVNLPDGMAPRPMYGQRGYDEMDERGYESRWDDQRRREEEFERRPKKNHDREREESERRREEYDHRRDRERDREESERRREEYERRRESEESDRRKEREASERRREKPHDRDADEERERPRRQIKNPEPQGIQGPPGVLSNIFEITSAPGEHKPGTLFINSVFTKEINKIRISTVSRDGVFAAPVTRGPRAGDLIRIIVDQAPTEFADFKVLEANHSAVEKAEFKVSFVKGTSELTYNGPVYFILVGVAPATEEQRPVEQRPEVSGFITDARSNDVEKMQITKNEYRKDEGNISISAALTAVPQEGKSEVSIFLVTVDHEKISTNIRAVLKKDNSVFPVRVRTEMSMKNFMQLIVEKPADHESWNGVIDLFIVSGTH